MSRSFSPAAMLHCAAGALYTFDGQKCATGSNPAHLAHMIATQKAKRTGPALESVVGPCRTNHHQIESLLGLGFKIVIGRVGRAGRLCALCPGLLIHIMPSAAIGDATWPDFTLYRSKRRFSESFASYAGGVELALMGKPSATVSRTIARPVHFSTPWH